MFSVHTILKRAQIAAAIVNLFALAACANAGTQVGGNTPLSEAVRNFPPMIIGANVHPTDGSGPYPRPCPAAGSRVEVAGQPAMEFLGASPSNPDLCRMRIDGDTFYAWYGIWGEDWPGGAASYPALKRIIHGRTGDIAAWDTVVSSGVEWHEVTRNEGIEDIKLLGKTYQAMKLAHYREGFGGNIYRSVSTVWKDIPTGLLIYGTYQHISGKPEIDDPIIPTAIVPAPAR
jgi:hypothetical protein